MKLSTEKNQNSDHFFDFSEYQGSDALLKTNDFSIESSSKSPNILLEILVEKNQTCIYRKTWVRITTWINIESTFRSCRTIRVLIWWKTSKNFKRVDSHQLSAFDWELDEKNEPWLFGRNDLQPLGARFLAFPQGGNLRTICSKISDWICIFGVEELGQRKKLLPKTWKERLYIFYHSWNFWQICKLFFGFYGGRKFFPTVLKNIEEKTFFSHLCQNMDNFWEKKSQFSKTQRFGWKNVFGY